VRDELKRLIGSAFGVPAEAVPDDASVGGFEPWNSLGHLELLMALEAEYGVVIPTEKMSGLSSLDAIEEFLVTQGALSGA
jgi:acyl carrier protein